MSTLHMDLILAEILPRLPFKDVTRFKCVSKSFHSKISSPYFLKLYRRYQSLSSSANDLLVLPHNRWTLCYDLNSDPLFNTVSTFDWYSGSVSIVGSCNGLLCVYGRDNITYLSVLNPTTHIFRKIRIWPHRENYNLGFAFDHVNFDYKIVAIDDGETSHYAYNNKPQITSVYSTNTNSWRVVNSSISRDSVKGRHDGALINGHLLHWFLWSPSTGKGRISCFDVCTMEWVDDVLFPTFYYDTSHENEFLNFGVFDDHLYSSFKNHVDSCYDVWEMKEYKVQESWFKLFSIPVSNYLQGGVVPVACPKGSDEILIRQCHQSQLLWYNNKNGVLREAKFNGASSDFSKFTVYTCSRSLIDIPLGKRFWNVSS